MSAVLSSGLVTESVPVVLVGVGEPRIESVARTAGGQTVLPMNGTPAKRLNRLGEVRRREGITRRTVARRLGISLHEVEQQEQPLADLRLSDIYRWQQVLGVPAAELLEEPVDDLSPPIQWRARLVRVMKTVRSLQERARRVSLRRWLQTLADQLLEVMPELSETTAWPSIGRRRSRDELGQAFFRRLSVEPSEDLDGFDP